MYQGGEFKSIDQVYEAMNNVAYHYVIRINRNIVTVLGKNKYKSSGLLQQSVKSHVVEAKNGEPPKIIVEFVDYGDYIGKRRLLWTRIPDISRLATWVEDEGFADGSGKVPGYKNGAPNLPAFKRAERIAWAMAKKKRRDNSRKVRQMWKKEALPDVLREMNKAVLDEFASQIEKLISETLKFG